MCRDKQAEVKNPFLPYEEDLFVADLSDAHLLLLNKYNVVAHHLLVVTRRFEPQSDLLNSADLDAAWKVLLVSPHPPWPMQPFMSAWGRGASIAEFGQTACECIMFLGHDKGALPHLASATSRKLNRAFIPGCPFPLLPVTLSLTPAYEHATLCLRHSMHASCC